MATTATAGSAPPPATALRDPGLYDYLPWNQRPVIRWPNGARVALPPPGRLLPESLVRWFVEQKERVQQELTFPKPRALAKDQGISLAKLKKKELILKNM